MLGCGRGSILRSRLASSEITGGGLHDKANTTASREFVIRTYSETAIGLVETQRLHTETDTTYPKIRRFVQRTAVLVRF